MRTRPSLLDPLMRREFIGRAATIAACAAITPHIVAAEAASRAKPNSVIHGVRIGVITYSYRGGNINTAEETLKALLEDGLSEVELMDGPIRAFAGIRGGGRRGRPENKPRHGPPTRSVRSNWPNVASFESCTTMLASKST